ncbi:MAG: DNA repair protein RecN [Verrucomicrobiota bacterium]
MLTLLRIKNLALVTELTLEWQPGCTVITGETGAGKSILIGALNLLLGGRADRAIVRDGADTCLVEAIFDIRRLKAPIAEFLEEHGIEPCDQHQLVLRRTVSIAGANRQFINGSPATLAVLSELGEWLVDIHGPHEHQSLLHADRQLLILDAFGGLDPARASFAEQLKRLAAIEAEKAALIVDEKTYAQQLDLLQFQASEISAARLQPGEDETVEQEHRRAGNAARLLQLCQSALDLLGENDASLLTQAGHVGRALAELHRLDPGADAIVQQHDQAVSNLRELQSELARYADKIDLDPERLQQLEERLNLLQSLKRKYGPGLDAVIAFGEEAARRLKQLQQRDAELARLNAELEKAGAELRRQGEALSRERRKVAPKLARAVSKQLADLGFKQSRFDVEFAAEPAAPNASGTDRIEFQFAPNPGEPSKPLRSIASSGELARVMLALKTVLAAEDQVPVLVFDEVDANVGGETAKTVGDKMRQIAAQRQVVCITHLPQVAAAADTHFVVSKHVVSGRTISEVRLLEGRDRVAELTRMLGGQTDAARKHAEALLERP